MNRIIILTFVVIILLSCKDNPIESAKTKLPDDSFLSDSLRHLYQLDAYRLAIIDMKEYDDNYLSKVEISQELFLQYYNGIIFILNSEFTTEIDSIMNIFQIHSWMEPRFNELYVGIETDTVLFEKITNNLPTGISRFDSLIQYYEFSFMGSLIFPEIGFFTYWTDKINNLEAICYELEKIPEIKHANPNVFGGDGNDIVGKILEDKIEYDFIYKWGDCFAGCTASHTWKFEVSNNGAVKFLNSFGDKIQ